MINKVYIKRRMLTQSGIAFLINATLLAGCNNNPGKKTDNMEYSVKDSARRADSVADVTYTREVDVYRKSAGDTIANNTKTIDELKEKMKHAGKKVKHEYENDVVVLEEKNKELGMKLGEYKAEGKLKWDSFKVDFSKHLDTVENEIGRLTSKIGK